MNIIDAYENDIFSDADLGIPKFIYTFAAISSASRQVKIALREDVTIIDHLSNGMSAPEKRLEVPYQGRRVVVHLDTAVGWGLAIPVDDSFLSPEVVPSETDVTKEPK